MRTRARRWTTLASGLLALSLLTAPGALAADPSASPEPEPMPAPSGAVPSGAVPSAPAPSLPPMDPGVLAALMAAIPSDLHPSCTADTYWQVPDLGPDPGEIASVDRDPDGSGGNFVSYSLFADHASAGPVAP